MKLFYYDSTGTHSSLIAAYIHLNKLPYDKIPSNAEIKQIEAFGNINPQKYGIPILMGKDEQGNEIYAVGFGNDSELALQTIFHLIKTNDLINWRFYNVALKTSLWVKISDFLIHILHLYGANKYFAAKEIRKNYPKIGQIVQKVKEWTDD
jgi:hypothetical protein